jgi:hypothetical protein
MAAVSTIIDAHDTAVQPKSGLWARRMQTASRQRGQPPNFIPLPGEQGPEIRYALNHAKRHPCGQEMKQFYTCEDRKPDRLAILPLARGRRDSR